MLNFLSKFVSIFPSYSKLTFCLVFKDHCCSFGTSCINNIPNQKCNVNNFFTFFCYFLHKVCTFFYTTCFLRFFVCPISQKKTLANNLALFYICSASCPFNIPKSQFKVNKKINFFLDTPRGVGYTFC